MSPLTFMVTLSYPSEIRACVSVIHIKTGVRKMALGGELLKDHFLILNAV